MSPNTKRSPATVPDRLATSSALPVTSPVAKRLAKCDAELSSATASLTRREQIFGERNVFRRGKFDKTVRQVGIAGRQRRLDVLPDDVG